MSRTACCFVALGISFAAFAAACGDDDGGTGAGGGGGSGGSGASGGSAGSSSVAGEGGSAGSTAGTGNTAGEGGSAGTGQAGAGNAGAGNAGTAGTAGAAGSGSVEEGDAGPDSGTGEEPDSGIVDAGGGGNGADAAVINGNCTGFLTGVVTASPQTGQDYVIARVIFDPDATTAHVTLRTAILTNFGDPQQLCSGPTDADCVAVDDGVAGNRPPGTEFELDITGVSIDGGELAFMSDVPSNAAAFPFAYVNWGGFTSVDPDGGGAGETLENRAIASGTGGFWTADESIDLVSTENAFFVSGETNVAAGFGKCTATQF